MLTPRRGTDRKLVRQLLTLDGGPVRPQPFVSGLLPSCGTSLRHCSSGRSEPPGFADCIILLQPLHHPAHLWHLTFQANMNSVHWYGAYKRETEPLRCGLIRSEEHTSELQSLMRISYAVFCLKQKIQKSEL